MHIVWKSLKKSHFIICILATKIAVLQLLFFNTLAETFLLIFKHRVINRINYEGFWRSLAPLASFALFGRNVTNFVLYIGVYEVDWRAEYVR